MDRKLLVGRIPTAEKKARITVAQQKRLVCPLLARAKQDISSNKSGTEQLHEQPWGGITHCIVLSMSKQSADGEAGTNLALGARGWLRSARAPAMLQ
jgi:hypothetical protein